MSQNSRTATYELHKLHQAHKHQRSCPRFRHNRRDRLVHAGRIYEPLDDLQAYRIEEIVPLRLGALHGGTCSHHGQIDLRNLPVDPLVWGHDVIDQNDRVVG